MENEKARSVREMFGAIAGRYDFLNHFLSANIDRRWRQACLNEVSKRNRVDTPRILDIGCGTADLSLLFSRLGPVIGCDFSQPMLRIAVNKLARNGAAPHVSLIAADALLLPFPDSSFDIVISAFVLRNLADMDRGLRETRRVLRPGGIMGILEFGMPRKPVLGALYRWYFTGFLPKFGRLISGVDGAYAYLPSSVQAFPPIDALKKRIERAGFIEVQTRLLTVGIAVLATAICGETEALRTNESS